MSLATATESTTGKNTANPRTTRPAHNPASQAERSAAQGLRTTMVA